MHPIADPVSLTEYIATMKEKRPDKWLKEGCPTVFLDVNFKAPEVPANVANQ